jgi:hypothetical protein
MNWQRTLIGAGLGALFVAMLVWTTLSQTSAECEVCVTHEGRTECSTAQAATRDDAVQQAQSSVCGLLSNGVTSVMACSRKAPDRISCQN